jgi:hypothetical protein
MKTSKFILAFLLLGLVISCTKDSTPTPPPATPAEVHLQSGLLLYLPFDGNMADSSGNANTTTAVAGATLTYDEHGYANSAFGGTGNGERIKVTNNGSIKFDTAFTISYDFMQRDNAHWQAYLSMVTAVNGYGPTFISGTNIIGSPQFDFAVNDSLAGCDNYGYGKPAQVNDSTPFIPQAESWYNAVLIYHKGTIQTFINGKLVATKSAVGPTKALLCPAAQIVVGGWWDGDPITMNGKIDEIRMYNRVLNADEIAELSKNFQ